MVLMAYRHGLRAAEVVDLRWEQVDFRNTLLHVRRAKGARQVGGNTREKIIGIIEMWKFIKRIFGAAEPAPAPRRRPGGRGFVVAHI